MFAEAVPISELGPEDLAAWQTLAERPLTPSPFLGPDFVLPAAEALEPEGLVLIVVREGDQMLACLPAQRLRWWRRSPAAGLVAWRHLYSFLGTPLIDAAQAEAVVTTLLEYVDSRGRVAFTALELVGDGETRRVLTETAAARGTAPLYPLRFERAALERRDDGEYVSVKVKHRREWNRQRRRLTELTGEELETVDASVDESAVEDFLRLEASGWKGEAGTAFSCLPGHGDFFRAVCRNFRERGMLQLLVLQAGERRLAAKCNLRAGDTIFCFKIAFDGSLTEFSPGMQLELDNIKFFHSNTDARCMDSCASRNNAMINRLWPDRRSLEAIVIPARGLRGRAASAAIGAAIKLRPEETT